MATSSPNLSNLNSPRNSNREVNDDTETGERVIAGVRSKSSQYLSVPGQQDQSQNLSLGSLSPSPLTSGGPRFSLGESPQRPKKGVLRKKAVRNDVAYDDGSMTHAGYSRKDEKASAKEFKKKSWKLFG